METLHDVLRTRAADWRGHGWACDVYTADITYPIDKESLLVGWEDWKDKAGDFGFDYTPYNFDRVLVAHGKGWCRGGLPSEDGRH